MTQRNAPNGAEALVHMLQAHGVKHIFGLCGDTSLPFYDAMRGLDHGMTHVLTRDERSAAYMADGYARVTGRPGICEGPSGGGATYILPGLIEANESSSAILAITTDISVASYGKYPLTEVDQDALMRPLTKYNTVIKQAAHIPRMVRAAFRAMTTGRPGAAHLGLPYDIQYDPVAAEDLWADQSHTRYPAHPAAPAPGAAEALLDALATAKRPLIVCGGGVIIAGACGALATLADRLDIAVATSISGKGALSDDHPQSLGVVGSNGGTEETWEMMAEADCVLFLGCRAGSTTTKRWEAPAPGTRILHIDSDPMVIGANYETEHAIVADLRLALDALLDALEARPMPRFGAAARVAALKARKVARFTSLAKPDPKPDPLNISTPPAPEGPSAITPLRPETVIDGLNAMLPQDAVVVSDPGTSCPYFNAYGHLPRAGRHYITNRAHGALGYAIGAAIGAQFGRPEAKVVAMMGDGSFGFSCGDLETAARYGLPITFLVLSNASFGWIKASQKDDKGARYHNVDFNRTDNALIAQGFGLTAWRVTDPDGLRPTLDAAFAHAGPTLIDIVTQPLEEAAAPVMRWMG
ncbi:thiamine pyrophosphate-binding protein [Cognatishimia sp. F0-27]|uniref:thiamine pyrophosphate-binding protein n=1 Tax=Cognatishimia sp. F0-27 TaxID=2816855 RepID=UPI001D0C60AD|nr:thiamine pyrophosphate-binding protein [Cognatishimia sp. F0-27]MCC1494817.1 thiamine pyrophosphate-binding protein [Cognatishimia sp. F0-27]